ncbi:TetR/AcrR family transcriptional regulator [Kordiimonas sp. SCSIO 12610]|uniref:TetR/AcrR family transcriptional regulator n=1 Tax=Kordiimonas sp. SCSIO 12610 TaxID=2829597 RepID=UPI00210D4196|nr:TetR/AcrR family transcriptional regulator [Kordiimonas sp. SCSIO 12610]UTW54957.1 TetR/AcrR family transcriptional regulator [Kordiimonas sp. SCSIO 12610]
MSKPVKRVRRTPEEAKALILHAAQQRLEAVGPEGLQVAEIANIAGVTHSTILHHFGSAEGVRASLAQKMVEKLLGDILEVLDTGSIVTSDHKALFRVFAVLSDEGNARLLAWTMLKGLELEEGRETLAALFEKLAHGVKTAIIAVNEEDITDATALRHAKYTIFQVALTAIGDGIAGDYISSLLGFDEEQGTVGFRDWFAERLLSSGDR